MKEQIQGTASSQPEDKPVETAANVPPADGAKSSKPATTSNPFLSPVDEMNSMPVAPENKGKDNKKGQKKPAKVAKNSDQ